MLSKSGAQYPLQHVPSVMFDEEIKVLDVPASSTSAEKDEDLWYSNREYFFMRRRATNMAKRMEDCDDEKDCSRGLEIVENNAVTERNKRIQELVQEVLQKQGQDADPEELAEISRNVSKDSRRKSLENAVYDAKHAEQYLSDTRKSWGRNDNLSSGIMRFFSKKRK
jgi:hypothetical protein